MNCTLFLCFIAVQYILYTKKWKIKTGGKKGIMKVIPIIVLVIIALFFLLPILSGSASIPEDISAREIGWFIGGFVGYWIDALKTMFSAL